MSAPSASRIPARIAAALVVVGLVLSTVGVTGASATVAETNAELDFVERINDIRKAHGLAPLIIDLELTAGARSWSDHMAAGNCPGAATLCHDPNLVDDTTSNWTSLGENVGWAGCTASAQMMDAFMASPAHRANLLNASFTRVGVGVACVDGMQFVTHKFMAVAGETISASAPSHQRFIDVPYTYVFHADINWAATNDYAEGYNDGTFRPRTALSRQTVMAFLHRLAGSPAGPFADPGLVDVPVGHTFYTPIAWAISEGIIENPADGVFDPRAGVSRADTAGYLHALAGSPAPAAPLSFNDVGVSHPEADAIAWAAAADVVGGFTDGGFHPGSDVTRQSLVAMLRGVEPLI